MNKLLIAFACGVLVPTLAAAQSFNLDIGNISAVNGAGSPSPAYGAAAASPGVWHFVDAAPLSGISNYTTPPLADVNGAITAVTAAFDAVNPGDTFTTLDADEPTTMGDDALLMDDIMYLPGAPFTVTFSGLSPGAYDVYTYAMAPDSATLFSDVDVPLGTGGVQTVGGPFPPAGHQQLVSYAMHTVIVGAGGTLQVLIDTTSDDSLNGFQLVGGTGDIGNNYCTPAIPNSTGQAASIAATGSTSTAANVVMLTASDMPAGQFGYFLAGQTQGFFVPPGSQGAICLTGNIGRYNNAAEIIQGPTGSIALDLTAIPVNPPTPVMAGETWNFQCWFRDNNPGATSNFTDGVSITFL